jgi:hypothetical protein
LTDLGKTLLQARGKKQQKKNGLAEVHGFENRLEENFWPNL